MAAKIDYTAVFSLQRQIIRAPELSDARKLKMLDESISDTLGEKTDSENE